MSKTPCPGTNERERGKMKSTSRYQNGALKSCLSRTSFSFPLHPLLFPVLSHAHSRITLGRRRKSVSVFGQQAAKASDERLLCIVERRARCALGSCGSRVCSRSCCHGTPCVCLSQGDTHRRFPNGHDSAGSGICDKDAYRASQKVKAQDARVCERVSRGRHTSATRHARVADPEGHERRTRCHLPRAAKPYPTPL